MAELKNAAQGGAFIFFLRRTSLTRFIDWCRENHENNADDGQFVSWLSVIRIDLI